ncbi:MAG: hypothetical protein ACJ786_41475 [Catenulispora sp.]
MKEVVLPVTIDFAKDAASQLGRIVLDADKLPRHANYVFAIGFRPIRSHQENGITVYDDVTLTEVSLVPDDRYFKYLQQNHAQS